MIKHNQDGAVNGVVISLVFAILLLIGALGFGGWAFSSRSDYKNNSDAKSAAAAEVAVQKESASKDAAFAEVIKNPLATYVAPEAYGSLTIKYPKTWSGYVDSTGKDSNTPLNGYFAPGVVPGINDPASVFALRVQVSSQPYATVVQSFQDDQAQGKLTAKAYSLPKVPNVAGVQISGTPTNQSNLGASTASITMVILPLRSSTLQIWTQGSQYLNDFNNIILPNFSFSP